MDDIENNGSELLQEIKQKWTAHRDERLKFFFRLIVEAYGNGMSVMEIKRAIGAYKVSYVIKTLVMHQVVSLPPVSNKVYRLPEHIRPAFDRIGFPFETWCYLHGFEPKIATAALQRDPWHLPAEWKPIHQAASNDFPRAYSNEYGTDPPEYQPGYTRETKKPSYLIQWDEDLLIYRGTFVGQDIVCACGKSASDVVDQLEDLAGIEKRIERLQPHLDPPR